MKKRHQGRKETNKKKTKEELKSELIKSLQEIDVHENEELDQRADQVEIHNEVILVVQD